MKGTSGSEMPSFFLFLICLPESWCAISPTSSLPDSRITFHRISLSDSQSAFRQFPVHLLLSAAYGFCAFTLGRNDGKCTCECSLQLTVSGHLRSGEIVCAQLVASAVCIEVKRIAWHRSCPVHRILRSRVAVRIDSCSK